LFQPVLPLYVSNLASLLPLRVARRAGERLAGPELTRRFLRTDTLRKIRIDGVLALAVHAGSAVCYGRHAWALVLLLMARCMVISFDDSVYHFNAPADPLHGYNLYVPRIASFLLLRFHFHGMHHRTPHLSWALLAHGFR